jgi:hypothetical protein
MRDFQEDPEVKITDYGIFLIRHPDALNQPIFEKLILSLKGYICSLEKIQKGSSQAIVGYFPHFVVSQFPSLGLIEIEDYILGRGKIQADPFILSRQITIDDSFAWKLQPKKKGGGNELSRQPLKIDLTDEQYTAWQVVFTPFEANVQITPRVIVRERDPQQKIELIKKVKAAIESKTSLTSGTSLMHSGVYEDYKKRTLIPKQVQSWIIDGENLKKFILD